MRYIVRSCAVIAVSVILSSCGPAEKMAEVPPPQEITADAIGHFCGMALTEHPGPKGQIFVDGQRDPIWFASVTELFAFTLLPEESKRILATYVTDMGGVKNLDLPASGNWIDAKMAHFVIGSRLHAGMGAREAVPFALAADAEAFAAANGGQVVSFAQVPEDYVLSYDDAAGATQPTPAPAVE